jgi:diaminopimelate decarboxylase
MKSDSVLPFYPPLTPKTSPWMQKIMSRPELLGDLFEQHGSPVNLHYLDSFAENYKAYSDTLKGYDLKYKIFFARKANVCRAFPIEAQRLDLGVDTASYRELKESLDLGCSSENLILTAAVKNESLVRLSLTNNVMMMLDNEDECRLVNELARELDIVPAVGIRISGFKFERQKLYSRFGFDVENAVEFISRRLGPNGEFDSLRFNGFHFHLDGYSIPQRVEAIVQTVSLVDQLDAMDIPTSFLDMGGGLLARYLSDKAEWNAFWSELKNALHGNRPPVTFGNDGLGYEMRDGEIHGSPDVYPFYNDTPKEQFLKAILEYQDDDGQTVASLMQERDIEFRMEPGRSLLDQSGMTVARVAHRKKDHKGDILVGLEMNRSQLHSSSADFLVDPIFIPMQPRKEKPKPKAVYFTGAYCLEHDLILKRKIVLPRLPDIGDVVAFPNTAGYMMHFYETRSHLLSLTTNLAADSDSFPHFTADEKLYTRFKTGIATKK